MNYKKNLMWHVHVPWYVLKKKKIPRGTYQWCPSVFLKKKSQMWHVSRYVWIEKKIFMWHVLIGTDT